HRRRTVPGLYPRAETVRGEPEYARDACLRAALAPRAADRQPRRRPALEGALSLVRAGAQLARHRHRAERHRRDQRAQDAELPRRTRAHLLCGGARAPRRQGAERRKLRRRGKSDGARALGGAGRDGGQLLDDLSHRKILAVASTRPGSSFVSLASLSRISTAVTMLVRTPHIRWTFTHSCCCRTVPYL